MSFQLAILGKKSVLLSSKILW